MIDDLQCKITQGYCPQLAKQAARIRELEAKLKVSNESVERLSANLVYFAGDAFGFYRKARATIAEHNHHVWHWREKYEAERKAREEAERSAKAWEYDAHCYAANAEAAEARVREIRKETIEECAKVCNTQLMDGLECAAAIRSMK